MDDKENLIEQYRQALKNPGAPADLTRTNSIEEIYDIDLADGDIIIGSDITSSLSFNDTMLSQPTITISPNSTSPYYTTTTATINAGGTGGAGYTYTGTLGAGVGWEPLDAKQSAKISLKGDDADIEVNGVSLCDAIRGIQDRLNMLCPDPEMEQEWDDLREIREQYEAKLQECRSKSRMWKSLKDGS